MKLAIRTEVFLETVNHNSHAPDDSTVLSHISAWRRERHLQPSLSKTEVLVFLPRPSYSAESASTGDLHQLSHKVWQKSGGYHWWPMKPLQMIQYAAPHLIFDQPKRTVHTTVHNSSLTSSGCPYQIQSSDTLLHSYQVNSTFLPEHPNPGLQSLLPIALCQRMTSGPYTTQKKFPSKAFQFSGPTMVEWASLLTQKPHPKYSKTVKDRILLQLQYLYNWYL